MWLVLDAGNSAAKGAFFDGPAIRHLFRLDLSGAAASPDAEAALRELLMHHPVERIGIASVVPAHTARLSTTLEALTGVSAEVVHPRMRLPFRLAYETPHTLGTDRLAAAAAARRQYGTAKDPARSVVVVDAGTALTLDVVDAAGVFRGGVIAAGPELLRRALHEGTAQLPHVPLELPETPVGRSTREAIQAGILFTFLDGVAGLLARLAKTLDDAPLVVATGGWAPFLQHHLASIDAVDPHLVLHGVRLLLELNT